jgi:hypothetical protein
MEEDITKNTADTPSEPAKPSSARQRGSLQQKLRAETDNFDFTSLLNNTASTERPVSPEERRESGAPPPSDPPSRNESRPASPPSVPPEISHIPRYPEKPRVSTESAIGPLPGMLEPEPRHPRSHRSLWPVVGMVAVAAFSFGLVYAALDKQHAPPGNALSPRIAAAQGPPGAPPPPASTPPETAESGDDAAPPGASEAQNGEMRLQMSPALIGPYTYWFVAATGQASPMQTLPRQGTRSRVILPVPVAYNQAGAQLRLLDQTSGKVARYLVTDAGRADTVASPQAGRNLLRDDRNSDPAQLWSLEKTPPAEGLLQAQDALEGPVGIRGNVLRMEVTVLGTENWHIQCYQAGINMKEGRAYQLTFWAKADRPRKLSINGIVDQPDWRSLGLGTSVDLTTNWERYTLPFTAQHVVPNHGRVSFVLGDAVGTVSLAGISLRPGSGRILSHPRTATSVVDVTTADFN